MIYKHTQPGYFTTVATGAGALYTIKKLSAGASKFAFLPLTAVLGGVAYVFSSLTIEISRGRLRSSFAGGVPAKTVDLDEIESVSVVTNPWYYGWGIKYTPHGWLYNVSGFDAVQIQLKNGRTFRLGTDEPERLRDAIVQATNGS